MTATGTATWQGKSQLFVNAVATANSGDIAIQTNDVQQFDTFVLVSQAGAMQVMVSLDGTNFTTAPLSLTDLGATTTAPVTVTAANRMYGFRGKFMIVQVQQNGAVAINIGQAQLRAGRMGG